MPSLREVIGAVRALEVLQGGDAYARRSLRQCANCGSARSDWLTASGCNNTNKKCTPRWAVFLGLRP